MRTGSWGGATPAATSTASRASGGSARNRPVNYQGIAKGDFYLHLRECEFRFNMRGRDMYRFLLSELRRGP